MNLQDFKEFAEEYKNSLGLHSYSIDFNNAKRQHGQCNYMLRKLIFSRYFIENNTQEKILNTLIHECAHALTKGSGHGLAWKRKCIELGLKNPERCSSGTDMPKGRYLASCENCGVLESITLHRLTQARKTARTIHTRCKGQIYWLDTETRSAADTVNYRLGGEL